MKITKLEIIVAVVLIALGLVFLSPYLANSPDVLKENRVRANFAVARAFVWGRLSMIENAKTPSVAVNEALELLNKHNKNPINKDYKAFDVKEPQEGVVVLTADDKSKTVEISAYGFGTKLLKEETLKDPKID